jgi:hypothetical protein
MCPIIDKNFLEVEIMDSYRGIYVICDAGDVIDPQKVVDDAMNQLAYAVSLTSAKGRPVQLDMTVLLGKPMLHKEGYQSARDDRFGHLTKIAEALESGCKINGLEVMVQRTHHNPEGLMF